jgi:mono/diheme cytochrome c family protein
VSQRNIAIAIVAIVLVGIIFLGVAGARREAQPQTPELSGINSADAGNTQLVSAGREVYSTYCQACHGVAFQGNANIPALGGSSSTPTRSDAELFAIVQNGQGNMPAFGNSLSDTSIWASLAYIKSAWPVDIQQAQEALNE